ncbi:MAG: AraC family transcriptional regulator [Treponema sp.]|jgi:AraC-like DNA-binding protein|nr:AraC family transcriptional regulator [Treponema sp.]
MDTIIDMLLNPLSQFLENTKLDRDGNIELILKRSYGEGTGLLKPAGKSLVVALTNLEFRRPFEPDYCYISPSEYSGISLSRGTLRQGIAGTHYEKDKMYHRYHSTGFTFYGIGILLLPEFFDTFLNSRHGVSPDEIVRAIDALGKLPLIPDAAVIMKQIGEASFTGDVGNIWIEAKALELISVILDWHKRLETRMQPPLNEHDQAGIAAALHYIEERFSGPLPLEALAKQAAMSMSKFTDLFKRHTGSSAACYIHRLRMGKAMDLVKNTSCPLEEVAAAVGYKHYTSFSTAFREQFGVVPGAFHKWKDKS